MHIRSATSRDLPRVRTLERQGFAPDTLEPDAVLLERIETFPDGFLVAEADDGSLSGYISSELWRFEAIPDASRFTLGHGIAAVHDPAHDELYISSMTVDPRTRGAGLGGRLLDECIGRCMNRHRGIHSALLLVSAAWPSARRIYERYGFRKILTLDGFFQSAGKRSTDGIVMRKDLRRV